MPLTLEQRIEILEDKVKHNEYDINNKENKSKSSWINISSNVNGGFTSVTTDGLRVATAGQIILQGSTGNTDVFLLNKNTGMWNSLNCNTFINAGGYWDYTKKLRYYFGKLYVLTGGTGRFGYTLDGVNWINLNNPNENPNGTCNIHTLDFDVVDMGGPIPRIYLSGSLYHNGWCYGYPFIIYTDDYGSNWVDITPDLIALLLSPNWIHQPYSITHYNQNIYIGSLYHILKYVPGTTTWSLVNEDTWTPPMALGIIKTSTSLNWGSGNMGSPNDFCRRTTDDGINIYTTSIGMSISRHFNYTTNDAYKGIYGYCFGRIYKSINDGVIWSSIPQTIPGNTPQWGDLCVSKDNSNSNSAKRLYVVKAGDPIYSLQL